MKRLKSLAKIFSFHDASENSGLFVTLDELIEQRQYVAYLKALTSRLAVSNQAGDVKSAFKGRGIELEEIRSYTFGDDIRDIDWRVTARKDTPFTKLYAEEKDREIYVLLDLSPYMVFGTRKELKSVAAAKVASLLGWLALGNKDRFGCIIFDGQNNYVFKPRNNQANLIAIFKKIAQVTQEILRKKDEVPNDDFAKSIMLLQKTIKSQATVFVISDFIHFDDSLKKAIAGMARKTKVYMINVFDVLEENPPKAGEYMAADYGQRLVFDSNSKQFQKAYKAYFALKRHEVKEFAARFGCRYLEVRTDIELYKQLKVA